MNDAKDIFLAALDCASPEELASYLDQVCAGDAALRTRVEELLSARQEAGSFLGGAWSSPTEDLPQLSESLGTLIGPYKLLEQIGEGGMGVVYMADQQTPVRRRVALKVIKTGMDTRQVIARFEAERQALALMDHSNIARVLDAGATASGRPYFVMELVRGIPITAYCDQNNLPVHERLELFIQVCHAVQHAHQKGIIHRDLKPSNVLVTINDGRAVPTVIDFGVAKATGPQLTEKTLFTAFAQMVGTPLYMSPEQAEMTSLDIDTRSDIYSLGVLLYELLTGTTPFDQERLQVAAFDEIRRIIREEEPPKPSTRLSDSKDSLPSISALRHTEPVKLTKLVAGDLDWIAMKCLEKDRTRRYDTATGLAQDIERCLTDQPVEACPPTRIYRLKKFVRRNKVGVLAGSAIVAALAAGLILASIGFIQARRQTEIARTEAVRADREANNARTQAIRSDQVAQFLKDTLAAAGPSVARGRDTTMLREIVDKTSDRISTDLKNQPEVEIELRLALAKVYFDLQEFKKMEATARETLRLARAHLGEQNLAAADALGQISLALLYLRHIEQAELFARDSIAMQRSLRGEDSLEEADTLLTLSESLRIQSNRAGGLPSMMEEAEKTARASLEIRRNRLGYESAEVAWSLHQLSLALTGNGKGAESEAAIRETLSIRQKVLGDDHPDTARSLKRLGDVHAGHKRWNEAETCFRQALAIQKKTQGSVSLQQIWTLANLSHVLLAQGKLDEAEICLRDALAIVRKETSDDYYDRPEFLVRLAVVLRKKGETAEARALAEEAVATCRRHADWAPAAPVAALNLLRDLDADAVGSGNTEDPATHSPIPQP